ncbi:XrtA system polysaccharide deacetylase [Oceanicoccus sagamiensis]|uniref:Polysaccharide deacetylase n=1 Tax=Oceanicoccus sagamiensis TaxID=716816 RepID=A0A1X9N8X4_9GAMM|nr:XrtA system polysaccharide deacetylase [Oceanicoccus sagamiensis]ARN74510.1 polysaccharide deacetylase [Oceanicoccus sagamiensis]
MSVNVANALTVDVEDYFQVAALSSVIKPHQWEQYDRGRVVPNTQRLMDMIQQAGHGATFFVLGWIAERYPDLVRQIDKAGFEVASHGYSHQLIYQQSPAVFREETIKSKSLLEDIIGKPVRGYRAASYSITPASEWALDILAELGFSYDSSLFPVKHDRYGMPGAKPLPHRLETPSGETLVEFSLTSLDIMGYRLPIAGGGYFRLFPYWFSQWALSKHLARTNKPFVFYLHPWEIDVDQPRVAGLPLKSVFRHYNNLDKCEKRLSTLLSKYHFRDMETVLESEGLLSRC